ncbi:hypothetical protein ACFW35_07605 [Fictibacillus sp. NPDC058756]
MRYNQLANDENLKSQKQQFFRKQPLVTSLRKEPRKKKIKGGIPL